MLPLGLALAHPVGHEAARHELRVDITSTRAVFEATIDVPRELVPDAASRARMAAELGSGLEVRIDGRSVHGDTRPVVSSPSHVGHTFHLSHRVPLPTAPVRLQLEDDNLPGERNVFRWTVTGERAPVVDERVNWSDRPGDRVRSWDLAAAPRFRPAWATAQVVASMIAGAGLLRWLSRP